MPGSTEADATVRIMTRAGGVFDAVLRSSSCRPGSWLAIFAESGGGLSRASGPGSCEGARVRCVVPAPEVLLTMRAYGDASAWELTFREPR